VAISPLFSPNYATLMKSLRLTKGLPPGEDGEQMVDDAITAARLRFYAELGASRVLVIQGTSFTQTPTTPAELDRALASRIETLLVRLHLLRVFPSAWMDASGDIHRRWNEEAPFREKSPSAFDKEMIRLEAEIDGLFGDLSGDASTATIHVWDGTPDEETPSVGASLERLEDVDPLSSSGGN